MDEEGVVGEPENSRGAGATTTAFTTIVTNDQDNETTNCSETMSTTANEEEEEEAVNEEEPRTRSSASARDRPGTPRRWPPPPPPPQSQPTCDDVQQQRLSSDSNANYYLPESGHLHQQQNQHQRSPDEPTTETPTLSELVNNDSCHAPPSYGTATKPDTNCTTLDARQLQLMQQQQANRYYSGPHYGSVHISNSGLTIGTTTAAIEPQVVRPLFGSKTIGRLDAAGQQQQQHLPANHQYYGSTGPLVANNMTYLSSSGSLPRTRFMAYLNSGAAPSDLRLQLQQQHHINSSRLDNNQAPPLLQQVSYQQQQLQHRVAQQLLRAGPPQQMNHVISGSGSVPSWQPQLTNQYYGGGGQSISAATVSPRPLKPPANLAQLPSQSSLVLGSSHSHSQGSLAAAAAVAAAASSNRNAPPLTLARPLAISGSPSAATLLAPAPSQAQSQAQVQMQGNQNNQRAPMDANQAAQETQQQQPLRRGSPENLQKLGEQARFSRRQQQQHQQALTRKRRRHRSTSGRSMSPESNAAGQLHQSRRLAPQHSNGSGGRSLSACRSQQQAQISAHCWLIDSSDDQATAYVTSKQQFKQPQHLTVAMMRQTAQQQQLQAAGGSSSTCPVPTSSVALSATMRRPLKADQQQLVYRDLTTDLRTNSLRMERILNKSESNLHKQKCPPQLQQQGSLPARRRQYRRRLSSASSDETSCGAMTLAGGRSAATGSANVCDHSGTVVRLSALLSLISNLVKRPAKSLKSSTGSQAALSSVSGSMQQQNSAPYVLATSSSSSTSAYATESSHPSSGVGGRNLVSMNPSEPAILLSQMKMKAAPSSTAGSSLFYSSSGVSGLTQPSSHGYEYCDQDGAQNAVMGETTFASTPSQPPTIATHLVSTNDQRCSPDSTVSSMQTSKSTTTLEEAAKQRQSNLSHMIMSDNELISVGSEAGFPVPTTAAAVIHLRQQQLSATLPGGRQVGATGGGGGSGLPARRRWQWLSMKDWLQRPCNSGGISSDSESGAGLTGLAATSHANEVAAAARYKALRSRRRQNNNSSTLQNILSLAKADRVFRLRLLASLVVSCILLSLICLLIGLLYARSSQSYQRNKSNVFIDEYSLDLPIGLDMTNQAGDQIPLTSDNSLRAQMLLVEQSKRLIEFQLTLTHLVNLQLASDTFIDITQLAKHLSPQLTTEPRQSSAEVNSSAHIQQMIQLSELDHDLVSLSLLSNLHWPLIKWKHQSQQAVANFLSFALPIPPSIPLGDARNGGSQTFRNLLSAVMLAELQSSSSHPLPSILSNNLNQYNRLNTLLRSVSYHLISCSYSQQSALIKPLQPVAKVKFCHLLINRYRKMMSTLTHLNQAQLIRLHQHMDMGIELGDQTQKSRTLPSFFLNQLALLDPQNMAAAVVASDDSLASGGDEFNEAIKAILRPDFMWVAKESDENNRWQPKNSLLDLAKIVIGNQLDESIQKLQPIELGNSSNNKESYEEEQQLAQDLFYPWPSSRLPQFATPLAYDIFLHPNLTTRLVTGMVKIEFQVERAVNFILLNCHKLNLVDLSVWVKQQPQPVMNQTLTSTVLSGTLKQLPVRRVLLGNKLEQLYIELQDRLEPWTILNPLQQQTLDPALSFANELPLKDISRRRNLFVISISFNKTSLVGGKRESGLEFLQYPDYYAQPEAEIKTMLYSQFEPANARRLFPCFDEPQFKAKFQLNLVHDQQHQVLFNAVKRERIPYTSDGQHHMSVFEPTIVPLSTYLISFVVYDAQSIKSITSRANQLQPPGLRQPPSMAMKHIQVQVLAQFELLSQAEFASQLVPQLLHFYQTHLQFAYPMDKLDLLALPMATINLEQQLESQAGTGRKFELLQTADTMENMGLIWFKANLLMVDPNLISQNLIEQVALIIAHQLAHQYFGNIVGIRSWQDLWLYESLCQYLESIALSHVQADWNLGEQFSVTTIQETIVLEQFSPTDPQTSAQLLLMTSSGSDASGGSGVSIESSDLVEQAVTETAGAVGEASVSELAANSQEPRGDLLELARFQVANSNDDSQQAKVEIEQQWQPSGELLEGASPLEPLELKRSSAVLHMLLFNLLPAQEAQVRLLRRCLNLFKYQTMSRHQFWRQFSELLLQEGSLNPLASLDLSASVTAMPLLQHGTDHHHSSETLRLDLSAPNGNFSTSGGESQAELSHLTSNTERVVLARTSDPRRQNSGSDTHYIKVRSPLGGDALWQHSNKLELVAKVWLDKTVGFPLVTATVYRDRIHLRQEKFSFTRWHSEVPPVEPSNTDGGPRAKRQDQPETDPTVWPIPLMFVSRLNQKTARFFWMDRREMELPYNDSPHQLDFLALKGSMNSWFKLNVNQSSLVRVNYDDRNWEALTELLVKSHYSNHLLSPLDRANLIDDALTLMRYGRLSVGLAMNLTLYLEVGERDYQPWTSALSHLDQMQTLLNQNPLWHRYVLKLMRPISSVIGWKDDGPHLMRKLRRILFSVALQYGDEKTIGKAKQEFKSWFKSSRFIVPNLQELVYVAGVRYGDQQEWFHCWQKYQQLVSLDSTLNQSSTSSWFVNQTLLHGIRGRQSSNSSPAGGVSVGSPTLLGGSESMEPNAENEKRQLLTALASTQNTWLLEQFLNYSLDSSKIPPQYLKHVMQTLGKNPVARLYLWRFVRLNWHSLLERYLNLDSRLHSRVLVSVGSSSSGSSSSNGAQENLQILETLIVESTKHFATKLDYEEVKTFFDGKRRQIEERYNQEENANGLAWGPHLERAIQQSLQIIRSNIYWRDSIEPKLTKWLSQYDGTIIS